jgi:hypothetical protein
VQLGFDGGLELFQPFSQAIALDPPGFFHPPVDIDLHHLGELGGTRVRPERENRVQQQRQK